MASGIAGTAVGGSFATGWDVLVSTGIAIRVPHRTLEPQWKRYRDEQEKARKYGAAPAQPRTQGR